MAAVVRHVHAAGPQAHVTLEQVRSREVIEAEISRSELDGLELKAGDVVALRLRQTRSFEEDYAI
jgi:sulfate transport system ATP-binding protein